MRPVILGDKLALVHHGRIFAVFAPSDLGSQRNLILTLRDLMLTTRDVGDLLDLPLPDDTSSLCQQLEVSRAAFEQGNNGPLHNLIDRTRLLVSYARRTNVMSYTLTRIRTAWPTVQDNLVYADFPHARVIPALIALPPIAPKVFTISHELYRVPYWPGTMSEEQAMHAISMGDKLEDGLQGVLTWHRP